MPFFVEENLKQGVYNGTFPAMTMFVDLSGFTPLTEDLMKRGTEGAEQLSMVLNDVFEPMVSQVYAMKGFIPHFAGDAFSAIFTDARADDLIDLSKSILNLFERPTGIFTRIGKVNIGIKIGLSYGNVEWGIVGDEIKSYFFRGEGLQGSVDNALLSERHEIIIDEAFYNLLNTEQKKHTAALENSRYKLTNTEDYPPPKMEVINENLSDEVLRLFYPDSIIDYREHGEFRNVISVFISFKGLADYDEVNHFATAILNLTLGYSGYFKEIDYGDKGGLIVVFFGAPVTYENIQDRALEYILALKALLDELAESTNLRFRIGMTSGLAFTGMFGGSQRVQYGSAGIRVNLAARLAIHAAWDSILVDDEMHKNKNFTFSYEGDIRYKGITSKIPTFRLIGKNETKSPFFEGEMIGRNEELEDLTKFISTAIEKNNGSVVYIHGEAGIGKSRLAYEIRRQLMNTYELQWFVFQTDQILRKPLNPFVHFLNQIFNQSHDLSAEQKLAEFEAKYNSLIGIEISGEAAGALREELIRIKSVLAARIGIQYTDSLWNKLDARGRLENTLSAIETLVRYLALQKPTVLMIEDVHWIDDISRTLVNRIARHCSSLPLTLVITARFLDDGSPTSIVDQDIIKAEGLHLRSLDLHYLQPSALKLYAEKRLQGSIGSGLFNLLVQTTNGNPFYVEQLIQYFLDSELLEFDSGEWKIKDQRIKLSTSVKAILMARIDRLSNLVKETVKAAAVIGREFELPVLSAVMRSQQGFHNNTDGLVAEQIKTAEREQIWRAVNELRYMFRHSLLREAVYDMQLRGRLRQLHQLIAEAIESLHKDQLDDRYVDLAFHFEQAEVREKTVHYLKKAADYASTNYQNKQALELYNRLLKHFDEKDELEQVVKVLLRISNIHEMIGDWDKSKRIYDDLLKKQKEHLSDFQLARINNAYGHLLLLKGEYKKARKRLKKAIEIFDRLDDTMGLSIAYGNRGTLFFRTGRYEKAKKDFTLSITLSQYHNYISTNANIISNLGLTHMNLGEYEEGIRHMLGQLLLSNQLGDQRGMAVLETNLGIIYFEKGDLDSALKHYQNGLEISRALGDKLLTSIAVGCIGNVLEQKGDLSGAFKMFMEDLQICHELGDRQGLSIAYDLLSGLHYLKGEFSLAKDYSERSLKFSEALSYKKGIAKSHQVLGLIHVEKKEMKAALEHFEIAEELGEESHNKKILASARINRMRTQIELGNRDIDQGDVDELEELLDTLQNEQLNFEYDLFNLQQHTKAERMEVGLALGNDMLNKFGSLKHKAAIFDELFQMTRDEEYRKQAVRLYRLLTREDALYHHVVRLESLTESN